MTNDVFLIYTKGAHGTRAGKCGCGYNFCSIGVPYLMLLCRKRADCYYRCLSAFI